ncbi:MAG: hypothetical protein EHM33_09685 [Chloroflexi bacterium]|nr:MAG: hypothetical protein EHM33_09685 [Chloroflexota bacterium]
MAELRCPKCGKSNPEVLDICQFCQTPLKPDPVLRIGQTPTKKNTGELESVLPDWLKDVRQQARDSAEEDAAQAAAQPKVEKNEPPDLLAGLVSQSSDAGEEEIPDWLASINPTASPKPAASSMPAPPSGSDFFAQFNQSEDKPASKPAQEDVPASVDNESDQSSGSSENDELSKWFSQASEQSEEVVEIDPEAQRQGDAAWVSNFDSPLPSQQPEAPKEEEDLSWLHNLEAASKQTGDLQAPKRGTDWMASFETPSTPSEPSRSQEDLSWLDNLGGIDESPQQAPAQPSTPGEDLSWLNNLGAPSEPQPSDASPDKPVPSRSFASEEDLSWLDNLGRTSEPSQPIETASESSSSSQEDLSWLNDLGGEPGPQLTPPFAEPESTESDMPPRQTAPLGKKEETEPDWLKSAMEVPSMPPPGDVSMDWFTNQDQAFDHAPSAGTSQDRPVEEKADPASRTPQPSPFSDVFSTPSEPSSLSSQDVDSLFSVEMPDWLSRSEPAADQPASGQTTLPPAESDESLAPVDLPSWVQAMRPMEAVISETASGAEDEPEETEGPLAGLRGVIPGMTIGSSMRPKSISLKLQATDEQQASAALLEKILGGETSPRALITSSFVASQQVLRWTLTALFLAVLGVVISLRSQMMPVSPSLPAEGDAASQAVVSLPANAKVLVVIDYEPSLAGEMEAIGGPLLDQMILTSHPNLSFVSTSPNGAVLVERMLSNTGITQAGVEYRNLGFLPGGSAGVLGFVERPAEIIPASEVGKFSDYAMLVVMTDHAESGRIWVEQLHAQRVKQVDLALGNQPLIVIASAQAGPLLQPYVSSGQITGMISGLSQAARYEYINGSRPGIARSYWDAFGVGLAMAIVLIIVGSLWSLFTGIRARRAEAEQG